MFFVEVTTNWSQQSQHVSGHTIHSPHITHGGTKSLTEDYALVEPNCSKFDNTFMGNVITRYVTIYLTICIQSHCASSSGTKINAFDLSLIMNATNEDDIEEIITDTSSCTFLYAYDRLFRLQNLITESEMHNSSTFDSSSAPCLMVLSTAVPPA